MSAVAKYSHVSVDKIHNSLSLQSVPYEVVDDIQSDFWFFVWWFPSVIWIIKSALIQQFLFVPQNSWIFMVIICLAHIFKIVHSVL